MSIDSPKLIQAKMSQTETSPIGQNRNIINKIKNKKIKSIDSSPKGRYILNMRRDKMLKIGDFANLFSISIKTVRYYEEKELFTPYYIDQYSGYRYYDDKNITEMSRILYLKELGFSLEEIKNYDETQLQDKIEEYKQKIITLKKNINQLENLNQKKIEKHPIRHFVPDERAIGKWKLIGIANTEEEAKQQKYENNLFYDIKQLYLMEKGQEYWVISWTKGYIYIRGKENPYTIENDRMYVKIVYPEDNSLYMVAVYEKQNNKKYQIEEIRKKDKWNHYYQQDPKLIGFWKMTDFVSKNQLTGFTNKKIKKELLIERITVNPTDNTVVIFSKGKEPQITHYTKGSILNLTHPDTVCHYHYERKKGQEYLVIEAKGQDYSYGKGIEGYYILEKKGGNHMEEMFESKETMYQLLSKEEGLQLAKEIYLPEDKRGNTNTFAIAGPGAGKTSSFVIPNLLRNLGNYVVNDPLGEIYERTHEELEKNGYLVKTINDPQKPANYLYNPFNHIRNEDDIDVLADLLVENHDDEFWNETSKCLMKTVLYYVWEREEKKDLLTCFELLSLSKEDLFKKLNSYPLSSKTNKYYSVLKTLPEKTYLSIASTAIVKLTFVINAIPDDRSYSEKFDFTELRQSKVAIFILLNENKKEDKKLANLFLSQLLTQLTISQESQKPIYFFLDEIEQLGKIYELPRNAETAKARNISLHLLTSNLEKLKSLYGNDFYRLMNTIDTQLFLGTNLKLDIDYFSDLSGIEPDFMKHDLGRNQVLIYEKGLKAILGEKKYYWL